MNNAYFFCLSCGRSIIAPGTCADARCKPQPNAHSTGSPGCAKCGCRYHLSDQCETPEPAAQGVMERSPLADELQRTIAERDRYRKALDPLHAYNRAMQDDYEKWNWVRAGEFKGMRPHELLELAAKRAREALSPNSGDQLPKEKK